MYFLIIFFEGNDPEFHGPFDKTGLEERLNKFRAQAQNDDIPMIKQVDYDDFDGSKETGYELQDGDFIIIKGYCVDTKFVIEVDDA